MSYSLTLTCGCDVYVSCHPQTGVPHTRIIERRSAACPVRMHEVGRRLQIWELLPPRRETAVDGRLRPAAASVRPAEARIRSGRA
jgi:hypothetical protein